MSNKKGKKTNTANTARNAGRRDVSRNVSRDASNESPASLGSRLKVIGLRALFFAIFLAISGFGMTAYFKYFHTEKPLHEFNANERSAFADALKASSSPTRNVWLACADGKTETCRLVKQFVPMFQNSGWKIEGGEVIQWKPAHPLGGVYLILRAAGDSGDTSPADAAGVKSSFTALGIPVQTASAPDVPKNSIGVFFGPDL